MKFECSAQELHTGLAHVTRALSSRPAMQILEGVLIHAEGEEVELLCSDGSLSIKCRVPAQISQMGDVVLPGRLLTEIVRKLPEGTVSFNMNDKMVVTIRCQQSRSTITGASPDEFPQMKDLYGTHALHFPLEADGEPARALRQGIGRCAHLVFPFMTRRMMKLFS